MSELLLEKRVFDEPQKGKRVQTPVNDEYFKFSKDSEEKLKKELNEYKEAWCHASELYFKY